MSVSISTPSGRKMASASTVTPSVTAGKVRCKHRPRRTGSRIGPLQGRAITLPSGQGSTESGQASDCSRGRIRHTQAPPAWMAAPRHPAVVHRGVHRAHLYRAGRSRQSGVRGVRRIGHAAVRQQRAATRRAVAQREGDSLAYCAASIIRTSSSSSPAPIRPCCSRSARRFAGHISR